MIKQTVYSVFLQLALASPFSAQEVNPRGTSMPPEFIWSMDEPVIRKQIIGGMVELQPGEIPGQFVLNSTVTWLSNALNLPAIYDHPRVERTPKIKLTLALHGSQFVSKNSVLSGYDDAKQTIYLPDDWSGSSPEGMSILIHEMVHHLQNVAGLQYGCPQEREKLAYVAQHKWLISFGRSLEKNFGMDPMTYLQSTECYIP